MVQSKICHIGLGVLLLLTCFADISKAQQESDEQQSLLPDIDPQDIEIRSEFQANFRGLSRQPILGFRPQPRLYQIDPDRTPFIESQQERMADLPVVELSRPAPPAIERFTYPPESNIYTEAGIGSFTSTSINSIAGFEVGKDNLLTARLNHHSSAGHLREDFGAFRNLDADIGYYAKFDDGGRLDLNVGGESNFNNLYPLSPATGSGNTRNEFGGAHVEVDYTRFKNNYEGWRVSANYDLLEARSTVFGSSATTREHDGEFRAGYQWTGNRLHEIYRVDVRGQLGQFGGTVPTTESWYRVGADVSYRRLLQHNTLLNGKVGVHGADEPFGGRLLLPSVKLGVKHWFGNNLIVKTHLKASLDNQSLKSRYEENPFILAHRPQFANSYEIGGNLSAEYQPFNRTLLTARGSYSYIHDYAFPARGMRTGNLLGGAGFSQILSNFYKTFYEDARVASLRMSLTHDLMPHVFWIDLTGIYRNHKLTGGSSSPIPYMANYEIRSTLYIKPISSFRINLWGEYVGPRRNADDTGDLGKYVLAGSKFEFRISDKIGVYIEGKNILENRYQVWEGYNARPLQLYGGVTVSL